MILPEINKTHRNILIATSIVTKIFVLLLLIFCFHSFVDTWDYGNYYAATENILKGLAPWDGGTTVMFPPLAFIPLLISYAVSLFFGGAGYIFSLWVLMALCDIVSILCIYWIGLKLYPEKTAFIAAMLYATAISIAYYSLCRIDSFPTCLAMLAILVTVYGDKTKGYLASVVGLFVKLWPIILYPFLWIYNSGGSSLIAEGKKRAAWILLAAVVLFAAMIAAGYNGFLVVANTVLSNTPIYLVSQYLQIAGSNLPLSTIVIIFHILTGVIIIGALYYLYKKPKTLGLLLKVLLISLMAAVLLMQYRSPQYCEWFMPFAALLLATDIWGILLFIGVQIFSFIEFPLAFWGLYTNTEYTSPLALGFFTLLFLAYGLLLWRALKMDEKKNAVEVPVSKRQNKFKQ